METMNVIFENYGGQQIGRIFKNYFTLAVLLKEVLFSFFIISADHPTVHSIPEVNSQIICNGIETESSGEELNWIQALQLILVLAQLETEKTNCTQRNIIQ